jgi:hypothetical protein
MAISTALLVDVSPFGLHAPPSGIRHLELMHVAPVWHWAFLSQANPNATLESIHFFSLRLQSPLVQLASCMVISAALLVDVSPFGLHAPPFAMVHLLFVQTPLEQLLATVQ